MANLIPENQTLLLSWKSFAIPLKQLKDYFTLTYPTFDGMVASSQNLMLCFKESLSPELTAEILSFYNGLTANSFFEEKTAAEVKAKITEAIAFGHSVVFDVAYENVLMGITQAGKTKLLADAFQQAHYYLTTGALYEAINEINQVPLTEDMAPFLTPERRDQIISKINAYLSA